jgi:hypothetical protein
MHESVSRSKYDATHANEVYYILALSWFSVMPLPPKAAKTIVEWLIPDRLSNIFNSEEEEEKKAIIDRLRTISLIIFGTI